MKKILFAFWLAIATGALSGQDHRIQFIEYELPNGLRVILHEDHSTPNVAVSLLYHVGSKNEDPTRTGFAHFFEHLMFEGSKHIPRGQYGKMIEGIGGQLNANTSFDRTFYYELVSSNQLELALWMEAERMLHLNVDEAGVETQRGVVKEERSQRIDNQPYGSILEEIFGHAFREHPYRWTPIGSAQYIDQARLDEFIEFYKTYYVPNNATLSIAGDLDVAASKVLIEKYFGDIPRGTRPIPRPKITEPPLGGEVRDTIYDNVQLPGIIMGYRSPAQGTPDFYAMTMLNTLLSGGKSSRLYRSLVDEQQKALVVQSIALPTEDPGLSLVLAIANMGTSSPDVISAIDAEIDRIKKDLISEEEYQKLQNQTENDFVSSKASVAGIAEALANYRVYYGDANLINTELDRYRKVSREDIRRVANTYLRPENRVVLTYLPKP